MPTKRSEEFIYEAAAFLDLMASEKRLVMLNILVQGEISVGALAYITNIKASSLSQQLAKLRAARLVDTRRDAQTIYYSCRSERVKRLLILLHELAKTGSKNSKRESSGTEAAAFISVPTSHIRKGGKFG